MSLTLDRSRETWPDIIRGFAIVTIVIYHMGLAITEVGDVHWKFFALCGIFAPIPLSLLFLISGIFSSKLMPGRWSAPLTFRIAGLIYVFVVWTIIEAIVSSYLNGSELPFDIIKYVMNPDSTLWFIWALVIFHVVAKLCFNRLWGVLLLTSLAVFILYFGGIIESDSFVYRNIFTYAIVFFAGIQIKNIKRINIFKHWIILLVSSIIYFVASIFIFKGTDSKSGLMIYGLLTWIAIPTAISGAHFLSRLGPVMNPIAWIGRNSLGVYLGHPIVILIMMKADWLVRFVDSASGPAFLLVFLLGLIAAFLSMTLFIVASGMKFVPLYGPPRFIFAAMKERAPVAR